MTRLELTYRRLMLAYPRGFRQDRGPELLTMLMDAARPGQRRPTPADAADLVLGGLRWRLRLPRGVGYRLVAVPVAVFVGLVAAAAVGLLSERVAPTEIAVDDAVALARTVVEREPTRGPLRYEGTSVCLSAGQDTTCEAIVPSGADPMGTQVEIGFDPSTADPTDTVTQIRDRLRTDGWQVGPMALGTLPNWPGHVVFWAARDNVAVRVSGDGSGKAAGAGEPGLTVDVHRQGHPLYPTAVGAAMLLGTLGGWLLVAGTLRRWARSGPGYRLVALGVSVVPVAFAALGGISALALAARLVLVGGWGAQDSLFAAVVLLFVPWVSIVTGVGLLLAGAVTALAPRSGTTSMTHTPTVSG